MIRFVGVADPPYQTVLIVAPGSEVVDVQIARGEDNRSSRHIVADLRKDFCPPIVSGAKKKQESTSHQLTLVNKVVGHQRSAGRKPVFVGPSRRDDIRLTFRNP